ncbi:MULTISPECIES: hypothetical protein [unclassified Bradyrhizobium]|uniref:hypothetical protein n=1 Tax=unclassified Bradyrhizobium TaxID=2631580 RepID=UPI00247AB375|nr:MULTISPECIES: hypothetical protein [unclassified Bradyrhizobium]WGR75358.1 hypothetical protein MTX24_33540 [Bradyrhizobium sp. ISRA426]WGR83005.1 hypothetical protein MTX21_18645 [Bradyrhizobium sp. ISRA430]WGR90560.1 hypothetical protein MTX25_33220 [Bradyrhizobium sp. ISRA432]
MTAARLVRWVLEEERGEQPLDADCRSSATMLSCAVMTWTPAKLGALVKPRQLFKVARQAVERLGNDDLELPGARIAHQACQWC